MTNARNEVSQRDQTGVLKALPKSYRDAPPEIQREWLLGRARQLLLLRKFTIAMGAFLLLLGFARLSNDYVVNAGELLLFAVILIAVVLTVQGLSRTRVRYETLAAIFIENEDVQ